MRSYGEMRVWLTEVISPLRCLQAAEYGWNRSETGGTVAPNKWVHP